MGKVKMIPIDAEARRFKKAGKVLEEYFNIADLDDLRGMALDILWREIPLSSRKKAFAKYRKTILTLKPLFKQYVIELNKVAKKDGYKNRIEYANHINGIPQEKFELFLEKADHVIKILNQKFPEPPAEWADWYWSKYNTPDPPCLATKKKYVVPDDIVKMIKKKTPKVATLLPKVKIQKLKDFYSSARYDKKKGKVIISTPLRKTGICGALIFVHEISHAVVDLDCVDKGVDLVSRGSYWKEREAHKVEFKLVKKLFSKKVHEAWLASFLSSFSTSLFEHEIYSNPKQDFDKIYARIKNRCLLKANQHKNPFYVLHPYYINQPGSAALASVAITELFSVNTPDFSRG